MTLKQNSQSKYGHDDAQAVPPDRLGEMLDRLPNGIRGIFGNMPGISVEDEAIFIDALLPVLKDMAVSIVHIHADFLLDDRESTTETLAKMLPARDGSDGRTVVIISGLVGCTRDVRTMIDQLITGDYAPGGDLPEDVKFLVVRTTSSHDPRMLSRLVKLDLAMPPVDKVRTRRRTAW